MCASVYVVCESVYILLFGVACFLGIGHTDIYGCLAVREKCVVAIVFLHDLRCTIALRNYTKVMMGA